MLTSTDPGMWVASASSSMVWWSTVIKVSGAGWPTMTSGTSTVTFSPRRTTAAATDEADGEPGAHPVVSSIQPGASVSPSGLGRAGALRTNGQAQDHPRGGNLSTRDQNAHGDDNLQVSLW